MISMLELNMKSRLFKEASSAFNTSMASPYLHTPGITNSIRPGLGGQHHYCDCTATNKLSNHFVTVLVSVQYLSLLCMKYCAVLSGLKQWRPEYMPSSTAPPTISHFTPPTLTMALPLQSPQHFDEFSTPPPSNAPPSQSPPHFDEFSTTVTANTTAIIESLLQRLAKTGDEQNFTNDDDTSPLSMYCLRNMIATLGLFGYTSSGKYALGRDRIDF
jgi:hypothetical protein